MPVYVSAFVMICILSANTKKRMELFVVKLQEGFLRKRTPGRDQLSTLSLQSFQTEWKFTLIDMFSIDIELLAMVRDYKK
jgi:hypothetical protein